ncbi:MAG: hypothetical protein SH809_00990 [Rhodothermales bacterium]|nr:hypothetical protein [Rhodothermales bacterium]
MSRFTLLLLLLAACSSAAPQREPASYAVVKARIWTGNPAQKWVEALRVEGGRIVYSAETP